MSYHTVGGLGAWYDYLNPFATQEVRPDSIVGRMLTGGAPTPVVQPANVALQEAGTDVVNAARTCANAKAAAAGYAKVIEPNILGARTCGLMASQFGEGCANRDMVMNTCVQRGIQFIHPTPADLGPQAEWAPQQKSFLQTKGALYLGLLVVGAAVFMKMRRNKQRQR